MNDARARNEDHINVDQLDVDDLRPLYMAERGRRETIRSQLAVPGSVVSFSIFGYIYFGRSLDVGLLWDPVTTAAAALWAASIVSLLASVLFLALVEATFLRAGPETTERTRIYVGERDFYQRALETTRQRNDRATTLRARGLLCMLLALTLFVGAIALLPFHMASPEWRKPAARESVDETAVEPDGPDRPDGQLPRPGSW